MKRFIRKPALAQAPLVFAAFSKEVVFTFTFNLVLVRSYGKVTGWSLIL